MMSFGSSLQPGGPGYCFLWVLGYNLTFLCPWLRATLLTSLMISTNKNIKTYKGYVFGVCVFEKRESVRSNRHSVSPKY